MSIGPPPHEQPAAEPDRADCASALSSKPRPKPESIGRGSIEQESNKSTRQEAELDRGASFAPTATSPRRQRSRQEG